MSRSDNSRRPRRRRIRPGRRRRRRAGRRERAIESAAAASSALTFNGPRGERRDHRHPPGFEQPHRPRARRAAAGRRGRAPAPRPPQPELVAHQAVGAGADLRAEPVVLEPVRLAHERQRFRRRLPPAADEPRLDPGRLESGGDPRSGTVHDADTLAPADVALEHERPRVSAAPPHLTTVSFTRTSLHFLKYHRIVAVIRIPPCSGPMPRAAAR